MLFIHAYINDALYYSDVSNAIASQIMKIFMRYARYFIPTLLTT